MLSNIYSGMETIIAIDMKHNKFKICYDELCIVDFFQYFEKYVYSLASRLSNINTKLYNLIYLKNILLRLFSILEKSPRCGNLPSNICILISSIFWG